MKLLFVSMLIVSSLNAFAECTLGFSKPRDAAMSASYITDKTYKQLQEILVDKGYILLSAEEQKVTKPEYSLKIKGYYGYGCGTGLTFIDYLTVPAYNHIKFTGIDGLDISFEKSFSSPVAVRRMAKRHLLKKVRSLPDCR